MMVYQDARLPPIHEESRNLQFTSLEAIPSDIVHLLADYCDVKDLVALSAVSKPLRDLLRDPGIWKKLYRRAGLLLPPGPYDWQSTSYLVDALLRAEKLYSVWPSSSSCPDIQHTRSIHFGSRSSFSVLLGRWFLVTEGSSLVCYDSQCSNICESAKRLFDAGRRILRVYSVGSVREDGILAFAVLVFNDSFAIAKVLMDQAKPSSIQTIITSTPIEFKGWAELVQTRLFHQLLVVNVGQCSPGWESSGRLVIMDVDTLRRYHIPASTNGTAIDATRTVTFFASRTHLIKAVESRDRHKVRFRLECFPLPTAKDAREGDVLHSSHQSRVIEGPKLRECVLIHESPIDLKTGKMSFVICGLNAFSHNSRLEVMEVCLEPDGSISFVAFGFNAWLVTSFCIGLSKQLACGVALTTDRRLLVFALDYHGPGSFSFKYSKLDCLLFGNAEVLATDVFGGTAFLSRQTFHGTTIEVLDFIRDARKAEDLLPKYSPASQLRLLCECRKCYMSTG